MSSCTWPTGTSAPHGVDNTSHGCINVAPAYIYWFYDKFGAGDIVDVTGTSRKLDLRNGLGDWVLQLGRVEKGSPDLD